MKEGQAPVEVISYREENGKSPIGRWMKELKKREPRVFTECNAAITNLEEYGHKLNRPDAAYLRDDIYELRISIHRVQYRILYFFYKRKAVVLTHGIRKEGAKVPVQEIEKAIERRKKFMQNPEAHTYEGKF